MPRSSRGLARGGGAGGMAGGAAGRPSGAALLMAVAVLTAAERELRFKAPPPAEAPVRLFTEPELARYDGQQVGPRRRAGAARLKGREAAGFGCPSRCTAWSCRSSALSPADVHCFVHCCPTRSLDFRLQKLSQNDSLNHTFRQFFSPLRGDKITK